MVIGKMSKCSFKSPCGKLVGVVHGDDIPALGTKITCGCGAEFSTKTL